MKTLITLSLLLLSLSCFSQETGSFDVSIDFTETDYNYTRELYFHVPSDYDDEESYPLVVGFRGGPHSNAGQFRDQLTFLSDSIGAIIMCPENEGHFWNNEGETKQLFQYSVEYAAESYNIDQDYIYLTGLSYGGRHAVIVAMDTESGNIPSIRGVIPFAAGMEADDSPDYAAIDQFAPACICIGLNDSQGFIDVSTNLHDDISSNGGNSILNEVPGVGHTVDFPTYEAEMMECFSFIEDAVSSTSIIDTKEIIDLILFPNPSVEKISFEIPFDFTPTSIFITDLAGKKVDSISPELRDFSVSEFKQGIYLLVIESSDSIIQERFDVD